MNVEAVAVMITTQQQQSPSPSSPTTTTTPLQIANADSATNGSSAPLLLTVDCQSEQKEDDDEKPDEQQYDDHDDDESRKEEQKTKQNNNRHQSSSSSALVTTSCTCGNSQDTLPTTTTTTDASSFSEEESTAIIETRRKQKNQEAVTATADQQQPPPQQERRISERTAATVPSTTILSSSSGRYSTTTTSTIDTTTTTVTSNNNGDNNKESHVGTGAATTTATTIGKRLYFYKTQSQRRLQQQLFQQHRPHPSQLSTTTTTTTVSSSSSVEEEGTSDNWTSLTTLRTCTAHYSSSRLSLAESIRTLLRLDQEVGTMEYHNSDNKNLDDDDGGKNEKLVPTTAQQQHRPEVVAAAHDYLLPEGQEQGTKQLHVTSASTSSLETTQQQQPQHRTTTMTLSTLIAATTKTTGIGVLSNKWNATPYDIDLPQRVRLASPLPSQSPPSLVSTSDEGSSHTSYSNGNGSSSSSTFIEDETGSSDPMHMEEQIWNGIDALMADAFTTHDDDDDGTSSSSICTEDVLPKALLRALSRTSSSQWSTGGGDDAHTKASSVATASFHPPPPSSPDYEKDEIQMAQATLNSFIDMLVPEDDDDDNDDDEVSPSSIPSLSTMKDSDSDRRSGLGHDDHDDDDARPARRGDSRHRRRRRRRRPTKPKTAESVERAQVALHNFMEVLLHDLQDTTSSSSSSSTTTPSATSTSTSSSSSRSPHSSKVQILDLFQWSLKVNIDAQEKIRYLERERRRLEEERQRELYDLMETELRLEQERSRRKLEQERRRVKIRQLEQHLAEEQQALVDAAAAANRRGGKTDSELLWASTPGGKPMVIKDSGSIDSTMRRQQQQEQRRKQSRVRELQKELQRSSGDVSGGSDRAMRYLANTSLVEPSWQTTTMTTRAPELEKEGPVPRGQANVRRTPSWTFIGGKGIVMASPDSVMETASHASNITNLLPSSFHEDDAIRIQSDSDSSLVGRRRRFSNGMIVGQTHSVGSSLDMPDLASINEDSVLDSIDSPPFVFWAGGDLVARQYPGGVPRVPSETLYSEPSLRQKFERVSSSGRIGLVSASGDVFEDDVSRYSFSKLNVDEDATASIESKQEETDGEARERRHTELMSVGSAGDIHHLVGSTVRFHENSSDASQSDESSSSESEEVTLDSDLHRDAQTDAAKPVPYVSRNYSSGSKRRSLRGSLKNSLKAMRKKGKCVTNSWFCERANKRYGDISKQSRRLERNSRALDQNLSGQHCLLYGEDAPPYDRDHLMMEPTTRLTIDDTGLVMDQR